MTNEKLEYNECFSKLASGKKIVTNLGFVFLCWLIFSEIFNWYLLWFYWANQLIFLVFASYLICTLLKNNFADFGDIYFNMETYFG